MAKPDVNELNLELERSWAGIGSRFPGMTYEQGVSAAIEWVLGYSDMPPISD